MVSTMRLIGQMASLGIATLIFTLIMGHVEISPGQLGLLMTSIKDSFAIFAVLCIIGVAFSLARGNLKRELGSSDVQ
jgi:hypothetical protein